MIYAEMWRRLLAFLADAGAFLLFVFLVLIALGDSAYNAKFLSALILWLAGIIASLRFSGTTPGKYIFNIEVRSSRPGQTRPTIGELAMRETIYRWMSFVLFMG